MTSHDFLMDRFYIHGYKFDSGEPQKFVSIAIFLQRAGESEALR
jgi:hypothetical protein